MNIYDENENNPQTSGHQEETAAGASTLSAQEIQALKNELAQAKERATYLSADFDNFRKRVEKDRLAISTAAQASVLADLLTIIDDFDRAFADMQQKHILEKPELATYFAGFELIYKSLQKLLAKYGVTEIDAQGQFNPELHEAVVQVDDPTKESGQIVQVLQKGYMFKGTVLRPAKVSVKP